MINDIISTYKPISLQELTDVKLMNRIDTKYIISVDLLYKLLTFLKDYHVLEINDERNCPYDTLYYDTKDYQMFWNHINDIPHRQKIRVRKYVTNNVKYFEIKTKQEDNRTVKERIQVKHKGLKREKNQKFIRKYSTYKIEELRKSLHVYFNRITLVDKNKTERLTIDTDIRFVNKKLNKEVKLEGISIVELKRNMKDTSKVETFFNDNFIKSSGFSKYCCGMSLINENLKNLAFNDIIKKIAIYGTVIINDNIL